MKTSLVYAGQESTLDLRSAELVARLEMPQPMAPADLVGLVERAMESPVGSPTLRELVGPDSRVAVLFDDATRPTPTDLIFPVLERALLAAGVSREHIYPVFAPGLHRLALSYMDKKAGSLMSHQQLVLHSYERSPKTYRGATSRGNAVFVNEVVDRVDLVASIGQISPHDAAGYGGGGKMVLPGIAFKPTVEHNHNFYLSPLSRVRLLRGNPVREDMDEAGQLAGLRFIVNTVTDPYGGVVNVVAGHPVEAHRRGVALKEEACGAPLDEPADIVVSVSNASLLNGALWSMLLAELAVRPGGSVIVAAPCDQGWEQSHVLEVGLVPPLEWMRKSVAEAAWMVVNREAPEIRQSGLIFHYRRTMAEKQVYLVNQGYGQADVESFGLNWAPDLQSALDAALERHGAGARVVVVPNGGRIIPVVKRGEVFPVSFPG